MSKSALTVGAALALAGTTAFATIDPQPGAAPDAAIKVQPTEKPAQKSDSAAPKLGVGDKAPALTIEHWVKGDPVTGFEKGKVYVVEFWATWCPPCRASIPHLTQVQSEYKDKGVTLIGISSTDQRGVEDVKPFVAKMGDKMVYTIAVDKGQETSKAYMQAAGQNGIPTAFIVNKEGQIAWIGQGYPMAGFDETLADVVADKHDIKKAAASMELDRKIQQNLENSELDGAMKQIDDLIAIDPRAGARWATLKFGYLLTEKSDVKGAYEFATKHVDGALSKEPEFLNAVAWMIMDEEGLKDRNMTLAKKAAIQANDASGGKNPMILDTVARAYFETGEKAKAVELQTKAFELAPEGDMKKEIGDRLEKYKAAK